MIARFHILLPFAFSIRPDEMLEPFGFEHGGYRGIVYPPCQSDISWAEISAAADMSAGEMITRLQPADPQRATKSVQVNGIPTIQADLLRLDFVKDDFDRQPLLGEPPPKLAFEVAVFDPQRNLVSKEAASQDTDALGDPPPKLAFEVANDILARVRSLARGCQIQPVTPRTSFWRLDYLTDDGVLVPRDSIRIRRRSARGMNVRLTNIPSALWQQVRELPSDYAPHGWDTLLLDAEAILPDVDAAVALANAALETFSEWLLDQLAPLKKLPPGLWEWINNRDHWMKAPSVDDRFDSILRAFSGQSLKDQKPLWEAYKNLRSARNSFSHKGKPVIGKNKEEVTPVIASSLVAQAQAIVTWCETLLPETSRRPIYATNLEFLFRFNTNGLPTIKDDAGGEGDASPSLGPHSA